MKTMKTAEILEIVNSFVQFIESDLTNVEEIDRKLLMHLDSLGLAQFFVNYEFDKSDYPDPPETNYDSIRQMVEKHFKSYGYYNTPDEIEKGLAETTILVGDAIDDIVDIYSEIKEVQWRFNKTSENDALWHFENNYLYHWGTHLRNLQGYAMYRQLN
jgi:hypothetical protein